MIPIPDHRQDRQYLDALHLPLGTNPDYSTFTKINGVFQRKCKCLALKVDILEQTPLTVDQRSDSSTLRMHLSCTEHVHVPEQLFITERITKSPGWGLQRARTRQEIELISKVG